MKQFKGGKKYQGGWVSAVIGAAGAIGGALLSNRGASQRNDQSIEAAREQMAFQERMSNTSYQRGMEDMRKAGLNPILAGKLGGASSPGGAQPTLENEWAAAPGAIASGVSSAVSIAQSSADVALKNANTTLTQTQNKLQEALVPGAEGVETITSELGKLADAVTGIIGQSKAGYEQMLGEMSLAAAEWMNKAAQIGKTAQDIVIKVSNDAGGISDEVKQWLIESYQAFQSSLTPVE